MQKLATVVLLLVSGTVVAQQVFRSLDQDGNVVFSDQPSPGAKEVQVQPVQGYQPPALPTRDTEGVAEIGSPDDEAVGYEKFGIVAPSNDDTIRDNQGNVDVAVTLQPSLRTGDTLRVVLNGEPLGDMSGPYVRLENIDRGTHTVSAEVVDESGTVVATADPVTFHLHRESVITRQSQGRN